MERKRIFAISGVKNSGKTTLICRLLEIFKDKGLKVAVLKHVGHDFVPDVPGTDTYCQLQSGAYGTAVFSAGKYMLVKQQPQISEKELAEFFPEADLILLEGFKYSTYPKIEIIRKGNSAESVCNPKKLMAIATNLDTEEREAYIAIDQAERSIILKGTHIGKDTCLYFYAEKGGSFYEIAPEQKEETILRLVEKNVVCEQAKKILMGD